MGIRKSDIREALSSFSEAAKATVEKLKELSSESLELRNNFRRRR